MLTYFTVMKMLILCLHWRCAAIQCRRAKESATETQNSPWDKKNSIENPTAGISRGQVLSVRDGDNREESRIRTTWAEEPKPQILENPDSTII